MHALFMLQDAATSGQVLHFEDLGLTLQNIGIYVGIAAVACGIVLGIVLMILGNIFGAQVGFGGAFMTMLLFAVAACGATFGMLYAGMIKYDDLAAAAQYGQLAVAMPYGFKTFLISMAAGFVIIVLVLSAIARDAQGDRAALGSVLFVSILMTAAGAAAFFGINYGLLRFAGNMALHT